MHPSTTATANDLALAASNMTSNYPINPNSYETIRDPSRFPYHHLGASTSLNYLDLLRTWNYHRFLASNTKTDSVSEDFMSDYQPRNGSFHQCSPRLSQKVVVPPKDDDLRLKKFHYETSVNLESGETKNIQQLSLDDFLLSAKQSRQYSSLFARVDHIGLVDQKTGIVELRFYIDEIDKTTTYHTLEEVPFFVQQYSCWSSVSPDNTHRRCGLKCRQLVCGDIILAITDHLPRANKSPNKPDYRQQSPTKCLVDRYMTQKSDPSNKRQKCSNE